jgi:hypothetical protein
MDAISFSYLLISDNCEEMPYWCDIVWIGAIRKDGEFMWNEGGALAFHNWGPGEPNNINEECVEFVSKGYWNDVTCDRNYRFFCEMDIE